MVRLLRPESGRHGGCGGRFEMTHPVFYTIQSVTLLSWMLVFAA